MYKAITLSSVVKFLYIRWNLSAAVVGQYCDYFQYEQLLCSEDFCLLGYNALYYVESQPIFRRNVWPPSSGLKSKPRSKKLA